MSFHSRDSEYFESLALAVYGGDLFTARAVLDEMRSAGVRSTAIMRAKRKVEPWPQSEIAKPIVLPVTGDMPDPFAADRRKKPAFGDLTSKGKRRRFA